MSRYGSPVRTLATRPPLRRLFWAFRRLLSGKPLKATDLAREFEVAVRTAYRDFDWLRDEWRVPLEYDHHQGTYRLTAPISDLPLVSLSHGELLAIYFAEKVLRQYRGTPFEPDVASAFAKMQELMPEEVKVLPGEPRRLSLPGPAAGPRPRRRGLPRDPDRAAAAPPGGRARPEPQQQPHDQPPHPPIPRLQPPRELVRRSLLGRLGDRRRVFGMCRAALRVSCHRGRALGVDPRVRRKGNAPLRAADAEAAAAMPAG